MNDASPIRFSDWCAAESVSVDEREHLAYLLRKLREPNQPHTGSHVRKITYQELMSELRQEAFRLERDARRLDAPVLFERAHVFDAACNLVLAFLMNSERINPILHQHRERMGGWRR